jgi:low temperature requirement protein LtrA
MCESASLQYTHFLFGKLLRYHGDKCYFVIAYEFWRLRKDIRFVYKKKKKEDGERRNVSSIKKWVYLICNTYYLSHIYRNNEGIWVS